MNDTRPTELAMLRLQVPQAIRFYDELDMAAEYRKGWQDAAFVILALAAGLLVLVLGWTVIRG